MAQLADVADHFVVLLHGQGADVLEAQHLRQLLCPLDGLRGVLVGGGDDEVGRGKVHLGSVLHAGGLTACHGVAGNELHPCRAHGLHRLHKAGLDAGHIREDAAGLEERAVGFEPLQQGRGVQAEDDVVGLLHQIFKIMGLAAGNVAVVEGILQVPLAAVDAVHMETGFGQLQGILAAQQTKTHHEITFCFVKHILPPHPKAGWLQRNSASSSGWLRRHPQSGAARRLRSAPQGS